MIATLTTKGQITIPKSVREKLRLEAGDKLKFLIHEDGSVELFPVTYSLAKLKGMVPKPKRPISLEEMDRVIREAGLDRD